MNQVKAALRQGIAVVPRNEKESDTKLQTLSVVVF